MVENIDEVYELIDNLSFHEDDAIFIYSHIDTSRSRIKLTRSGSYLFIIEKDALYSKEVTRKELEKLLGDFEVVKDSPEFEGFLVEDLY